MARVVVHVCLQNTCFAIHFNSDTVITYLKITSVDTEPTLDPSKGLCHLICTSLVSTAAAADPPAAKLDAMLDPSVPNLAGLFGTPEVLHYQCIACECSPVLHQQGSARESLALTMVVHVTAELQRSIDQARDNEEDQRNRFAFQNVNKLSAADHKRRVQESLNRLQTDIKQSVDAGRWSAVQQDIRHQMGTLR